MVSSETASPFSFSTQFYNFPHKTQYILWCLFFHDDQNVQLVGGTGMTERMKDHLRQPCILTELCKFFEDDTILTGPAIGKGHNQIEVLILVAQEAFQLVLGLLPFPQNVSLFSPDNKTAFDIKPIKNKCQ